MKYDCVIIKDGQIPFIYEVNSPDDDFLVVDTARKVSEEFKIRKIEEIEPSSGKKALFLVSCKLDLTRDEIVDQINKLTPKPVKYFN